MSSESTAKLSRFTSSAITPSWLVPALLGLVVGYMLGGSTATRGSLSPWDLAIASQWNGYGGNGDPRVLRNMMIFGGGMGGLAAGVGLPQTSFLVHLIFYINVVYWLPRLSLWETLFSQKLPITLRAARWVSLGAAMMGGASGVIWLLLAADHWFSMVASAQMDDLGSPLLMILFILSQCWALGFWITIYFLLFVLVQLILRRAEKNLAAVDETD